MKTGCSILLVVVLVGPAALSWSQCPDQPNDFGICDTMYYEPWSPDIQVQGDGPHFVRVPIYVSHDLAQAEDSITSFVIPLCYTHSNPAEYC
ncbi:MAG: hypothetical protein WBC98_13225, partial [Candidatus Zixiibacteriota bacterium]